MFDDGFGSSFGSSFGSGFGSSFGSSFGSHSSSSDSLISEAATATGTLGHDPCCLSPLSVESKSMTEHTLSSESAQPPEVSGADAWHFDPLWSEGQLAAMTDNTGTTLDVAETLETIQAQSRGVEDIPGMKAVSQLNIINAQLEPVNSLELRYSSLLRFSNTPSEILCSDGDEVVDRSAGRETISDYFPSLND